MYQVRPGMKTAAGNGKTGRVTDRVQVSGAPAPGQEGHWDISLSGRKPYMSDTPGAPIAAADPFRRRLDVREC
jgi:hypothetical protein